MNAKRVFLAVNASSRWLNNVTDVVLSPGFLTVPTTLSAVQAASQSTFISDSICD
jgi:hypothetical protein